MREVGTVKAWKSLGRESAGDNLRAEEEMGWGLWDIMGKFIIFVSMKRLVVVFGIFAAVAAWAGPRGMGSQSQQDGQRAQKVTKADYEQAARFSSKHMRSLVYSTRIRPNWFRDSDKFWYSWKTAEGTRYWIVDPATGSKTEVFDMPKLARELTEITKDPYDAQHIPLRLKLIDDKTFQWDLESKTEKRDSAGNTTGKFVEYRFYYDIASKKLTYDTEEHKDKYPHWANVSPDGSIGIYVKNHNLWVMDRENLEKAAKDDKDSTLVERALTTDGTKDFSWLEDTAPPARWPASAGRRTAGISPWCAGICPK